ncbi:thiamine phosphate synthase [Luteipulveratus halotolerans]|uniref:Thiamine phosphate synthase/TenI domain-containing protein n=1 Tax=Luteipulveratus halotolerans TaxID=1631356 RepID=A0A0L6CHR9_9MICO|nr:thiamine phosphate synthase [Luteipulveratus halotolerans]KNX37063.1 hypothetical protein VV01_07740 [Luteipulveratus halotolerans]
MRPVPRLLLVTDRTQVPRGRRLTDVVAECIAAGASAVFLRERDLDPAAYDALADTIRTHLDRCNGVLIARDSARAARGHGVHLRMSDPQPRRRPSLLGRSVHDHAQLASARVTGCDYVTFSPVHSSASKPGYGPPLGAAGLTRARAAVPGAPPILALGGVEARHVEDVLTAGAHGVAVMGSVMRARDPAAVVDELLTAVRSHVPRPSPQEVAR